MSSDGPFLQRLAKYETCTAPSAGSSTRNLYRLTGSGRLLDDDRTSIITKLCAALDVQFEDTKHGIIHATSVANFKIWPTESNKLESLTYKY